MLVTFYSFKGGVGRSMALVNVGEILAERGYDVVLCDWDLEAPGLERYVSDEPAQLESLRAAPGIIDLLLEYKDSLTRAGAESDSTSADFQQVGKLRLRRPSSYARPIPGKHTRPGALRLLTAGRRNGEQAAKYAEAIQAFDWSDFYSQWAGASYFEFWRRELSGDSQDRIVLIDSRTGVTEQGGVCTHHLADVVVLMTAANDLNLEGVAWMADVLSQRELLALRDRRSLAIVPVASRIDQTAQLVEVNAFRERLYQRLGGRAHAAVGDAKQFLLDTEIPYVPFYSFTERVAAREDQQVRDPKLHQAYGHLATGLVRVGTSEGLIADLADAEAAAVAPDLSATLAEHAEWIGSGGARGRRADLRGASLNRINLTNAKLDDAVFDGAQLRGARLADASLRRAKLAGCELTFADLRAAHCEDAVLDGAKLTNAKLPNVVLTGASCSNADFVGADLQNASLRGCRLANADLSESNLSGANLLGADLHGAKLETAGGLTADQLTLTDCRDAKLPVTLLAFPPLEQARKRSNGARALISLSFLLGAGAAGWVFYGAVPAALSATGAVVPDVASRALSGAIAAAWILSVIAYIAALVNTEGALRKAALLPRVFPDGDPAAVAIAPWLPRKPDPTSPPLGEVEVVRRMIFWGVPVCLVLLFLAFLPGGGLTDQLVLAGITGFCIGAADYTLGLRDIAAPRRARFGLSGWGARWLTTWFGTSAVLIALVLGAARALGSTVLAGDATSENPFSSDGRYVATVDHGQAILWRNGAGDSSLVRVDTIGAAGSVYVAVSNPSAERLLTVSVDQIVRVWSRSRDGARAQHLDAAQHIDGLEGAAFSADGRRILTWSRAEGARVLNADSLRAIGGPFPHSSYSWPPAISPDGQFLLRSESDTSASLHQAWMGLPPKPPAAASTRITASQIRTALFRPDSRAVLTVSNSGNAALWTFDDSLKRLTVSQTLKDTAGVISAAFSRDGRRLVIASSAEVHTWDLESRKRLSTMPVAEAQVAEFSPDGRWVVTGAADGVARIWEVETGRLRKAFFAHQGGVRVASFSPEGRRLLTSGRDGKTRIWSLGPLFQ
jgi:uncharacterized protein YjbI with pentapeptide repeats/WD40 repeat protein